MLDELPMIWVGTLLTWSMLDQTLFFGWRVNRLILPTVLLSLVVWITVTYVTNGDPVFHQVAYASIMVVSITHAIFIMVHPNAPLNVSDSSRRMRADARRLERQGTISFIVGFAIWNVDNIFCGRLRAARDVVGYPWAMLLEGHGWWHIFTGVGACLLVLACEVITMSYMEHPDNFVMVYSMLPYLKRVKPYNPSHTLLRDFSAKKQPLQDAGTKKQN